ncbi:MAG TPA: hypothetical protein VL689_01380, partial [Paraburkholderia sp.]|nr:hypothetical protein [Paraburkholderia sp.]
MSGQTRRSRADANRLHDPATPGDTRRRHPSAQRGHFQKWDNALSPPRAIRGSDSPELTAPGASISLLRRASIA